MKIDAKSAILFLLSLKSIAGVRIKSLGESILQGSIGLSLVLCALAVMLPMPVIAEDGVSEQVAGTILIENVRHWNGSAISPALLNVLVEGGVVSQVSHTPIVPPSESISVNGEGRVIAGNLDIGGPANLIVVDGDPSQDITLLAEESEQFLLVRRGELSSGQAMHLPEISLQKKYRTLDPSRFKIVMVTKEPWYSYRKKSFSATFIGGALLDSTNFNTDNDVDAQIDNLDERDSGEVRTVRAGVGGFFKVFAREFGYVLVGSNNSFRKDFDDGEDDDWTWIDWALATRTWGGASLKLGKQKENFSHDLRTILVDQAFMERAAVITAFLPSRNTGLTLSNNTLGDRMTWSLGTFRDMLGDRDPPDKDSKEYISRVTGLAYTSEDEDRILHLGGGYRYLDNDSGKLRFSTTPEVYSSPDFLDTGEFRAESAASWSGELGWKHGPFWLSSEYIRTDVRANEYDDPIFEGFHVTGLWALTGERRGYDRVNGLFKKIVPQSDVRSGGPGAWELAARYSELDLDDEKIEGGDMSRLSIGLNWWPTREFKASIQYGRIDLDRFGLKSSTDVFQARLAFLLGI
jgi:phosphate-selective porin OprO/OprP